MFYYYCLVFLILIVKSSSNTAVPCHCTEVTKETNLMNAVKLDYSSFYIASGQREVYIQMYCLNPPAVAKAYVKVCDWYAAPQVNFSLGDEYLHIVRQDPSGKYLGTASVTAFQHCGHAASTNNYVPAPDVPPVTTTATPTTTVTAGPLCRILTKLDCE